MNRMGSHSAARGGPLRRAWISAWIVTVAMGGTTMAFQVYHSVKFGHLPWELAVLYGIVPLLIAILVLEIVAEWTQAPRFAKLAAYAIMGAAMFLSASATGAVVLHAAPAHFSLLPGALLDGAELLAAYFIMNGPRALDRAAQAEAEKQAAAERAEADERTALRAELEAVSEARAADVSALRDELDAERTARETAQREAVEALARAEKLDVKLAAATAHGATGRTRAKGTANARSEDLTTELRAVHLLDDDPTLREPRMGGELARRLGVSPQTGRRLHSKLTKRDRENEALTEESQ